jgi:Radical SAM superfamily
MTDVVMLSSLESAFPIRYAGPHALKTLLLEEGISTRVLDFVQVMSWSQVSEILDRWVSEDTLILGLSTTFWIHRGKTSATFKRHSIEEEFRSILVRIKERFPRIRICVGGANSHFVARTTDIVDACFVGYADDSFIEYCHNVKAGRAQFAAETVGRARVFRSPPVARRNKNGSSILWTDHDHVSREEVLPLETARGCIFKCKFCSYPNTGKTKLDYLRSNEEIRDELVRNYETNGTTVYNFLDDTYNDSLQKVSGFANMVAKLPFKIHYTGYLRADLIYRWPETAEMLLESGLVSTFFGIETLHPRASLIVGKGWSGKHAREYIPELTHKIWRDRVNVQMGLIIGLPGEEPASIWDTYKWVEENRLNGIFYSLKLSGDDSVWRSEFDVNAEKYGIQRTTTGWKGEFFDSAEADRLSHEINEKHRPRRRVDNWIHTSMLAMGVPHSDIMKYSSFEVIRAAKPMADLLVEEYVAKCLQ